MTATKSYGRRNLWILAHADDEILGLRLMDSHTGSTDSVIYLTDGVRAQAAYSTETRKKEAKASWESLSKAVSISFFGTENSLPDGNLAEDFNKEHYKKLLNLVNATNPDRIITLAFEGGHQDHDMTSLIAASIATKLNLDIVVFSAYRALYKYLPFYAVMSPNSSPFPQNLRAYQRLRLASLSLKLMKIYRTQKSTWVGLGPFVFLKYLLGRSNVRSQSPSESYFQYAPTKYLYINRKKAPLTDYQHVIRNLTDWQN